MGFNHGWLVQARRRPALFGKFKAAIATDGVAASDVAFYFGTGSPTCRAVPAPLEGSVKFVLKFPSRCWACSRQAGRERACERKTETQVFETYLEQICAVAETDPGPAPQGDDAIALMRWWCRRR